MKTITIHQPEHLSYLGFWDKISRCDTLVLLDNVDYEKNYFQNRNKILTNDGEKYITVPVTFPYGKKIKDVRVSQNEWPVQKRKIIETLRQSYSKAPFFDEYFGDIEFIYNQNMTSLFHFNLDLIVRMIEFLGIDITIKIASCMNVKGDKSSLLANICDKIGADKYISGKSGIDYLDESLFTGIQVTYQDFKHPKYNQINSKEFVPYLSVIDGLFNVGGKQLMKLIKEKNERAY